jgi:hypothetical protein
MVSVSEDGQYYSAYNGKVNSDADNNGLPFMVGLICCLFLFS